MMAFIEIAKTSELLNDKKTVISEQDKEFILWFAFATGDKELTDKLIEELMEKDIDKQIIRQKYETVAGIQPDWIRKIETLLVALELYRMQEEKTIKNFTEILNAYGVDLQVQEVKENRSEEVVEYERNNSIIQMSRELSGEKEGILYQLDIENSPLTNSEEVCVPEKIMKTDSESSLYQNKKEVLAR